MVTCSEKPKHLICEFSETKIVDFNYAFSIQKGEEKIDCYLIDTQINIRYEKDKEKSIAVTPDISIKFKNIMQQQLELKNVMCSNNNLGGIDVTFYKITENGYISVTYKKVNDFTKEISPEFDSLVSSILTKKNISNPFKKW